jgi:hypothetical protein
MRGGHGKINASSGTSSELVQIADTQRLVVGAGGALATRSSRAWSQDRGGTMTMSEVKGKPIGTV